MGDMLNFAYALMTGIFAAGGAWAVTRYQVRQLRQDVNGIGGNFQKLKLVVLTYIPNNKREHAATLLK